LSTLESLDRFNIHCEEYTPASTMSDSRGHPMSAWRRAVDRIKWFGRGIGKVVWDNDDKSDEERRFVRKLDCLLMTIVSR
jgi:hypothetical protein